MKPVLSPTFIGKLSNGFGRVRMFLSGSTVFLCAVGVTDKKRRIKMRATVEVYENNAGGICVAVFGQNGLTNLFVVTPDGNETRMTRAFYQEASYGFPGDDEYNAEDFSGLSMDDAYADICNNNLIAEFYDNRVVNLYPADMGIAGMELFGMA
jgi:hypothetical protein